MNIITQRDLIRGVARKWKETYYPFDADGRILSVLGRKQTQINKKEIYEKLESLNKESATPEEVFDIIGNDSWTRMNCDECKKNVDALINLGEEPNYDSSTASLCRECVSKAASIF